MGWWSDITGKTAAKNAEREAASAQSYLDNNTSLWNGAYGRALGQSEQQMQAIQGIIDKLMQNWDGGQQAGIDSKTAIDALMGRSSSPEQIQNQQLTQNFIRQLTGQQKSQEQQTADQWNQNYLSLLQNSPDVAFNTGVANLANSVSQQQKAVKNEMTRRGINGSGIALDKIAGNKADYASGMNALQGIKTQNELANAQAGANFANGLAAQNLQNQGLAYQVANNAYNQNLANLYKGAALSQSNNQQNISNLGSLYGQMNTAMNMPLSYLNGLTGSQSSQSQNHQQMSNNYAQQAAGAASGLGSLIGGVVGSVINPVAGAAGAKLGEKWFG